MSDFLFTLIGTVLGIIGAFLALEKRNRDILKDKQRQIEEERERYATSKQKEYAAQREFEHLKRNQEQMRESLKFISEELERRQDKADDRLQRIEILLSVGFNKVPALPENNQTGTLP